MLPALAVQRRASAEETETLRKLTAAAEGYLLVSLSLTYSHLEERSDSSQDP